jgi:hypothetical protein
MSGVDAGVEHADPDLLERRMPLRAPDRAEVGLLARQGIGRLRRRRKGREQDAGDREQPAQSGSGLGVPRIPQRVSLIGAASNAA